MGAMRPSGPGSFLTPNVVPPPTAGIPEPPGLTPAIGQVLAGIDPSLQPAAPADPYANDEELLAHFKDRKEEAFENRWAFERYWWKILLYILGRQWITFDTTRGQYQDKRLARWVPRPVTNKCQETVETVLSVFQSVQLQVLCKPEGNDPKDITTAATASAMAPGIHLEHNMDQQQQLADFWMISLGTVFLHVWWDAKKESGFVNVPYSQCDQCQEVSDPLSVQNAQGMCPACGAPSMMGQAIDPATGEPKTMRVQFGSGATDVCSPLEIAAPATYSDVAQLPFLFRTRFRPRHWYEKNRPEAETKKLNFEKAPQERSLQLLRSLATQTDISPSQAVITSGAESLMEGMTEYELWEKPSIKYPEGLVLRVIENGSDPQIQRQPEEGIPGPLPAKTPKGDRIFPWVQARYEKFGGRLWGRALIERILQKQDQINQLDSLIMMIVMRVANPVWLEPKGAEVKRFTGEPGLVVKYSTAVNGAKPERIEGQNIPATLFRLREMWLADIETLAGTYDVTKGAKPAGVEAFSALQLLVERSQSRFGPVLNERGRAYRDWFSIALEYERQFGPDQRTLAVLGPNNGWTFQQFQNADLQGGVRIAVEDGSQAPKTSLGKRAAIEQLRNMSVIDPTNPDTMYRILQVFGATDLYPQLDANVTSALQEQDAFERWAATASVQPLLGPTGLPQPSVDPTTGQPTGQPAMSISSPPPVGRKPWHDDAVHLSEHLKWANGDTMRTLMQQKPFLETYVAMMIQEHQLQLMAMQAQQAAAAAPPQSGGGRAMQNSNQESGNPRDVPNGTREDAQRQGPQ